MPHIARQVALLVIVALLGSILAASAVLVASRPRLPEPFGVTRTGLLAYGYGGEVFIAERDGTRPRALPGRPGYRQSDPVWSPDGTLLAYHSWPIANDDETDPDAASLPGSIWVSGPAGDDARSITGNVDAFAAGYHMSWSPDSRSIAFVGGRNRLYIAGLDGSPPREIGPPGGSWSRATWSPDGSLIAMWGSYSGALAATSGVHVIRPDGTGLRRLTPGASGATRGLSWSPDGARLLFATGDRGRLVVGIARRDGDDWTTGILPASALDPAITSPGTETFGARWSNSGTHVAFFRGQRGSAPVELVVAGVDDQQGRVLVEDAVDLSVPCWTPDDQAIAVVREDPRRPFPRTAPALGPLVVVPVDGSSEPVEVRGASDDGTAVPESCSWQRLAR